MTGVELPADYSNIFLIMFSMIGFVAFMRTITVTNLNDSRLFRLMNFTGNWNKGKMKRGREPHWSGFWMLRKCGFIKPGEWQCNCGRPKCWKAECETFGELCKGVGGTNGTLPIHPLPDRKAAVAHTKAQS